MKYIVDRFEGNTAVCENSETGQISSFDITQLPSGVREGDVIEVTDGEFTVSNNETKDRRSKSKSRLAALFARSKKKGE